MGPHLASREKEIGVGFVDVLILLARRDAAWNQVRSECGVLPSGFRDARNARRLTE